MRKQFILSILLLLAVTTANAMAQSASTGYAEKSKKTKSAAPIGTPVFWKNPTDIATRNLFLGQGGEESKPDLSRVTFVKEDTVGYSPKFRVRDAAGKEWVAKMGDEAQPETAASRLVWAAGYMTETNYLFPCVKIEGAPVVDNSRIKRCEAGGYANVKFEARPADHKKLDIWGWGGNPFKGTREFQGIVVMMAMFNNWDLKDTNNKIIYVPGADGAQGELRYVVGDLGATFGKTGSFLSHTRNRPDHYAKTRFVEGVRAGKVSIDYNGKNSGLMSSITVEQARWIGGILAKLSDEQIADAFRAANYSQQDVMTLAGTFRSRINQLVNLKG